jgi:hypothetical protein
VVSFTLWPLYPQEKSSCYPLDRRLGGPQSQSEHDGEEKNTHPLLGFKPHIIQPIAQCYATEISQLMSIHIILLNFKTTYPKFASDITCTFTTGTP